MKRHSEMILDFPLCNLLMGFTLFLLLHPCPYVFKLFLIIVVHAHTPKSGRLPCRRRGIKHIREVGYCPPVAVPILFIIESPHVPPDTVKFFIRKLNVLLQHHNGFITMPRKKGCIVIFPTVTFQQRGKGGLFRASVVVHLAKIVKHTHNVGAAFKLPFQFKPFRKGKKGFGYCKAMIEQRPGISPVVVNGSRGCEEPVFNQPFLEFF